METQQTDKRDGRGELSGVVKNVLSHTNLPQEFISAPKSFTDALAKANFKNEAHKNSVILLWQQLEMFDVKTTEYPNGTMNEEKQGIINYLTGGISIGGYSRVEALMAYCGILLPTGLRTKTNKEDAKMLTQIQTAKAEKRNQSAEGEGQRD